MVLSIGYLTVYKMHQLSVFVFFTVAVTVVVVTNLPVNFAVDLAGAMRQGRQHLFHLARTHKQAATHTHTHRAKEREGDWEKEQKDAKSWEQLLATFLGYLFGSLYLALTAVVLQPPFLLAPAPPPPSSLHTLFFLPHTLCIFLSVKFNFHIEWNTSRLSQCHKHLFYGKHVVVVAAVAVPAAFYSLTPFYDRFLACKIIKTLHTANNEPNNKQQQAEQAK